MRDSRETERFVLFSNDPDNQPVSKSIVSVTDFEPASFLTRTVGVAFQCGRALVKPRRMRSCDVDLQRRHFRGGGSGLGGDGVVLVHDGPSAADLLETDRQAKVEVEEAAVRLGA